MTQFINNKIVNYFLWSLYCLTLRFIEVSLERLSHLLFRFLLSVEMNYLQQFYFFQLNMKYIRNIYLEYFH